LERSGAFLFRWRSYPPLLLAAIVVLAVLPARVTLHTHRSHELWESICLLVALLGLAIRAHVVGHAPRGTSGRNISGQQADQLNTTGFYSVVRHPLYLGNLLMWLGPVMVVRSPWAVLVTVLAFWLYYERIMFAEEEFLRRSFGAAWSDWAAVTPAVVPRWSTWRRAALPLSLRNVLKREYSGLFAVAAAFAFADWVDDYATWRAWRPDALALVVLSAGAVLYVALRAIKKHTRLLEVPGR
jgi:protein-S-isoprenylcysteine O-methyltransferase Ste14